MGEPCCGDSAASCAPGGHLHQSHFPQGTISLHLPTLVHTLHILPQGNLLKLQMWSGLTPVYSLSESHHYQYGTTTLYSIVLQVGPREKQNLSCRLACGKCIRTCPQEPLYCLTPPPTVTATSYWVCVALAGTWSRGGRGSNLG